MEHPLSKQALSKYEKGLAQPTPSRISDIARALDVTASSLLSEDAIEIKWVAYRKHVKLSQARQNQLTAIAQQRLEGEFKLRRLFHLGDRHDLPGPIEVQNLNDCEYAAAALRMRWDLGDRPIDGLIELIEERGGSVVGWQKAWGFDALSGWAGRNPVLVLNTAVPPDRLRFNAAHEIGHLVMESTADGNEDERFAMRFAAALLVPAEVARRELGTHRRGLDLDELGLLKRRWGLSMQGLIRRAHDLGIIGQDLYRTLNIQFRSAGWHRTEPYRYESSETPALIRRLVLRALAENMITSEDAERILPGTSLQSSTVREPRASLRDLARQSPEERHRVLREVAVTVDPSETVAWDQLPSNEIE
jgi:Zn-dependent peptidase ImmA (M78 family)/DNA-binding transcriptional regulator YdaS (Cro superfamily)